MYNSSRFDNNNQRQRHSNGQNFGQRRRPQESKVETFTPIVFTHKDKTVPAYTVRQAFEHAAMVYRAKHPMHNGRVLFPADVWSKDDEVDVTLTLEKFSEKVNNILRYLEVRN